MNINELQKIVAAGEDSRQQFKRYVHNIDSLAAEMAAFTNSEGGMILIGVADDGAIPGLSSKDVSKINQLISNAASQHVRSPLTVRTENVLLESGHVVIVLRVPRGIDKPYFDKNGIIWLKSGADKRRVNSKEELRRLFQSVDLLHADAVPTKASVDKLDKLRFRDFFRETYKQDLPDSKTDVINLLENMNLATGDGKLNLAGVLLFTESPQWIKPAFIVKAVLYPGADIDVAEYLDSEDFEGPMQRMFEEALAFIMRNLRKVQAGQSVNSPGKPEIPQIVFEELLVNALIHRDYFIIAPIRLFIFNNRIEIISPGHLPNNLTVEKIKTGNSAIRNPILASFAAKMLPYRGLGTGVKRALETWPHISFVDDRKGPTFKCIIRFTITPTDPIKQQNDLLKQNYDPLNDSIKLRDDLKKHNNDPISDPIIDFQHKLLAAIRKNPQSNYENLAVRLDVSTATIKRHIKQLKEQGLLKRIGSKKTGHWEVSQQVPI